MKKAVITDFSGTLADDTFPGAIMQYEEELGLESGKLMRIISTKYWPRFSLDEITEKDFWYGSLGEAGINPIRERDVRRLRNQILGTTRICAVPMVAFYRYLRGKGIKTGVITNAARPWFEFWKEAFADLLEGTFDTVVTSYETKLRKPDPRIYRCAADALSVAPQEAIYIDNESRDVQGAESTGMDGILFDYWPDPYRPLEEAASKLCAKEGIRRDDNLRIYFNVPRRMRKL